MKKSFVLALVAFQLALLSMIAGRYEYVMLTGKPIKVQVQAVDPLDYFRGQYVALAYPMSTWTGGLDPSIRQGSRVFLTLDVSSTGSVDAVTKASANRSDCGAVCIGAKLLYTETVRTYDVRYTDRTASGELIEKVGRYVQAGYGDSASSDEEQWFKEGEPVEVGSYSGTITYVTRPPKDNANNPEVYGPKEPVPGANPALKMTSNGRVEKLISSETSSRFEFDASRFYVREGTGHSVESLIRESKVYANLRVASDGKSVVESLEYNGTVIR